jgi:cystathionine beta-lyase/cystathionine gamma-synthase
MRWPRARRPFGLEHVDDLVDDLAQALGGK